mmetsp:Transcript_23703/g.63726  ORF Transcript_23703/g.63726 Transcript_23703/m.63726 type:complete len:148 (-) Transcript_23703:1566-2009(-)
MYSTRRPQHRTPALVLWLLLRQVSLRRQVAQHVWMVRSSTEARRREAKRPSNVSSKPPARYHHDSLTRLGRERRHDRRPPLGMHGLHGEWLGTTAAELEHAVQHLRTDHHRRGPTGGGGGSPWYTRPDQDRRSPSPPTTSSSVRRAQ